MSLVDTEPGEVVAALTPDRARDLTERLRTALSVSWELVKEAHAGRAWAALGYESWDAYCEAEFDGIRSLRLPREERAEVVASLRDAGFSIRAIAAVTGAAKSTIEADVSRIGTPDESLESPEGSSMPPVEPDEEGGSGDDADGDPAPPDVAASLSETSRAIAANLAAQRAASAKKVTGTDGRQYPAARPKPVETDDQIRAREEAESDKRAAAALQEVVERWSYLARLRRNPRRDLILACLTDHSRRRVLDIEKELHGD